MTSSIDGLVQSCNETDRKRIEDVLSRFPVKLLEFTLEKGIKIRALTYGEKYQDASEELRELGIDVDGWPTPPSGLFVPAERTMYLRKMCAMTIAHEYGHAIDCAFGENDLYRSFKDPAIRKNFSEAARTR